MTVSVKMARQKLSTRSVSYGAFHELEPFGKSYSTYYVYLNQHLTPRMTVVPKLTLGWY